MSETHAPYLHVVRLPPLPDPDPDLPDGVDAALIVDADPDPDPGPVPDADPADTAAPVPLSQAIMNAVVGWLALCMERVAVAVDIQPIADRLYEVSAHFDEQHSAGVLLRVRLDVEPGLVVRTTVEPLRPS